MRKVSMEFLKVFFSLNILSCLRYRNIRVIFSSPFAIIIVYLYKFIHFQSKSKYTAAAPELDPISTSARRKLAKIAKLRTNTKISTWSRRAPLANRRPTLLFEEAAGILEVTADRNQSARLIVTS